MTEPRPWQIRTASQLLVEAVENAGGLLPGTLYTIVGYPDWQEMGKAYLCACEELGIEPKYQEEYP